MIARGTLILCCVLSLLAASLAQAQGRRASRRSSHGYKLGIGAGFDVGGEVDLDGPDADLRATIVFPRVHFDKGVTHFRAGRTLLGLAVGGKVRASWWEADDDIRFEDRSFFFDTLALFHLTIDWQKLVFRHGLAAGMVISAIDDRSNLDSPTVGAVVDYTLIGVEFWFRRRLAAFVDFGITAHFFEHDHDFDRGDTRLELRQVMMEGGILFGL